MKFALAAGSIVSLGLFALVTAAQAEETKIPLAEVPKAVLDAIKVKFPTAQLTQAEKETEDGETTYEVGLKDKGASIEVAVSTAGKILEIEKKIAAKDLPKAVIASVEAKHPGSTITKAEEIVEFEGTEEEKSYEVVVAIKGKKAVELTFSPSGKLLEEEEDEEHEGKDKGKGKADKD